MHRHCSGCCFDRLGVNDFLHHRQVVGQARRAFFPRTSEGGFGVDGAAGSPAGSKSPPVAGAVPVEPRPAFRCWNQTLAEPTGRSSPAAVGSPDGSAPSLLASSSWRVSSASRGVIGCGLRRAAQVFKSFKLCPEIFQSSRSYHGRNLPRSNPLHRSASPAPAGQLQLGRSRLDVLGQEKVPSSSRLVSTHKPVPSQ